jgi:hypothetical protein
MKSARDKIKFSDANPATWGGHPEKPAGEQKAKTVAQKYLTVPPLSPLVTREWIDERSEEVDGLGRPSHQELGEMLDFSMELKAQTAELQSIITLMTHRGEQGCDQMVVVLDTKNWFEAAAIGWQMTVERMRRVWRAARGIPLDLGGPSGILRRTRRASGPVPRAKRERSHKRHRRRRRLTARSRASDRVGPAGRQTPLRVQNRRGHHLRKMRRNANAPVLQGRMRLGRRDGRAAGVRALR